MYLGIFKENGERYTSLHTDVHGISSLEIVDRVVKKCRQDAIKDGYVGSLVAYEISDEEQVLYQTNEYIRDLETGKPALRPPYVPTQMDRANSIASQYTNQIAELKDALATATLAGDEITVAELRAEYAELMTQYQTDLEVIENDEKM